MKTSKAEAGRRESIERLIERIYSTPSGPVRTALVAMLAAEESLAAAMKDEAHTPQAPAEGPHSVA